MMRNIKAQRRPLAGCLGVDAWGTNHGTRRSVTNAIGGCARAVAVRRERKWTCGLAITLYD